MGAWKYLWAIVLTLGLVVGCGAPAIAAEVEEQTAQVRIHAHFETAPDYVEVSAPCSSWTSVPKQGTCRALARNTKAEQITGDVQGQSEYVYGVFIMPTGSSDGGGVDHFTGKFGPCGEGSLSYQQQFRSDSAGKFEERWQVV